MKLAKLLERLEYEVIQGTKEIEIAKVVNHSKEAGDGTLFVCITGMRTDGRHYIDEAVKRGAVAIVSEKDAEVPGGITHIRVKNTRKSLAEIAAAFYGYPAQKLRMVGVTGTKGKTTTTCMIREILEAAGHKTGLIGTIEVLTGKRRIPAENTSPESVVIQGYLREMVDAGCDTAVMEVSSQGLKLCRVEGIFFDIGVFTNLGEDHIGKYEHESFGEYKACKAKLFRQCRLGIANADSPFFREIFREASCRTETYGFTADADYQLSEAELEKAGKSLGISYRMEDKIRKESGKIVLSMPGVFNSYNSAAALVVCRHLGVPVKKAAETLADVRVRGRVESVEVPGDMAVIVDYAHNAMSLQSLLEMVHSYNPAGIVTVFGCGGNRAKDRRYEMGRVSGRLSDLTVITSDNPRYEEPSAIMKDIREGISETSGSHMEICDRKEAVRYALTHAKPGEVILIVGKGHEDYQEIRGVKYHMDDRELIEQVLEEEKERCTQI